MVSKNSRLKRNTLFLYAATIVKLIGPLVTLPYLTRVLSVETYGYVSFVKSYATYAQLLLDFGFLLSATKEIALAVGDSEKIGRIAGDTVLEKALLAVAGTLITAVLCTALPLLNTVPLFTWLYYLSCVSTILILDFLYRGLQRMEYAAIPLVIAKIIVVVFTVVFVRGDDDLLLVPLFELMGNACAGLASLALLRKVDVCPSFSSPSVWFRDLKESGVYFLSNFATSFFGALTTFVVGIYLEMSQVAFWSLCMTGVSAAKAIYAPLGNSIFPYMVENRDFALANRIARMGAVPLAVLSLVVFFFGDGIMSLVGGESYAPAGSVLTLLLPVMVFSFYSMLYGWPVLGVFGSSREVTLTTIGAAVLQIACVAIVIATGQLNLTTLALCCGLSEFFLLASRLFLLRKEIKPDQRRVGGNG